MLSELQLTDSTLFYRKCSGVQMCHIFHVKLNIFISPKLVVQIEGRAQDRRYSRPPPTLLGLNSEPSTSLLRLIDTCFLRVFGSNLGANFARFSRYVTHRRQTDRLVRVRCPHGGRLMIIINIKRTTAFTIYTSAVNSVAFGSQCRQLSQREHGVSATISDDLYKTLSCKSCGICVSPSQR